MTRALVVAIALVVGAPPALAQADAGAGDFQAGVMLYRSGDYAAAAAKLKLAYDAAPSQKYLFAWAQAERRAGHCGTAVPLYERLLDSGLSDEQTELVKDALVECEGQKSSPEAPAPVTAAQQPEATAPVAAPVIPPPPPAPAPISGAADDSVAWGPLATGMVGVAAMAAGAGLWDTAEVAGDGAAMAGDAEGARDAEDRRRLGWIVGGAGLALTAGAVIWAVASGDDEEARDATARVSPWVGDSAAGVVAAGRF